MTPLPRDREVPDGHPQQCAVSDCKRIRRVKNPMPLCSRHRTALGKGKLRFEVGGVTDQLLIPEDGVLDAWAALIAAKGYRTTPPRLSQRERQLATAMILSDTEPDAVTDVIMNRLGVSQTAAWQLIADVKGAGIDLKDIEFSELQSTSKTPEGTMTNDEQYTKINTRMREHANQISEVVMSWGSEIPSYLANMNWMNRFMVVGALYQTGNIPSREVARALIWHPENVTYAPMNGATADDITDRIMEFFGDHANVEVSVFGTARNRTSGFRRLLDLFTHGDYSTETAVAATGSNATPSES